MDLGLHISDMPCDCSPVTEFASVSPSIYSHLFSWVVQFDSQHGVKAHHEGAHLDLVPGLVSHNQVLQVAFPQPLPRPVLLCHAEVGFFRSPGLRGTQTGFSELPWAHNFLLAPRELCVAQAGAVPWPGWLTGLGVPPLQHL